MRRVLAGCLALASCGDAAPAASADDAATAVSASSGEASSAPSTSSAANTSGAATSTTAQPTDASTTGETTVELDPTGESSTDTGASTSTGDAPTCPQPMPCAACNCEADGWACDCPPLVAEAGFIDLEPVEFIVGEGAKAQARSSSPARIFYNFHPAADGDPSRPLFVLVIGRFAECRYYGQQRPLRRILAPKRVSAQMSRTYPQRPSTSPGDCHARGTA